VFAAGALETADVVPQKTEPAASAKLADAREALSVLGYSRSEVAASLKNVDENASLEDIIRDALQSLMK
jgi:Holliday junction resolvasome RuvABC DNA-binding subunit